MIRKFLPILLILFGAAGIVVAFTADLLGLGGDPGIGTKQILLALIGGSAFTIGVIQRYNLDWRKTFYGPSVSPVQLLRMAICLGLLSGFLEALMLLVRKRLHLIINLNPHLFWMKPVSYLILFLILSAIMLPLLRKWPKTFSLRVTAFVFVFLACLSPMLAFSQLHIWARILLAAGISVQVTRLITIHADGFQTTVRRLAPFTVALAAAVCVGVYALKAFPEYRDLAKLPPAKLNSPNVLLLVLDTVRAQSLSLYGYHRPTTPHLEQFAKTGVCFDRALSTSPWTLPAHATMFTGRLTHELFADGQTPLDALTPVGSKYQTLAEALSAHGYVTAGFVANVGLLSHSFGIDRGFAHYQDYVASLEWFLGSGDMTVKLLHKIRGLMKDRDNFLRRSAADINQSFLNWLSGRERRPFFAFLNYFDAHDPYVAPDPFNLRFGSKKPRNSNIVHSRKYTRQEIQELQDAYESCIAYIDHEIGSLLDELEKRGVLENTVVIISSDHGEQFGEHGLMYHVNSLYRQLLQVPLIISFPNTIPAGERVLEPVSLRDLPATVVDLIGLDAQVRFPGASLSRYWGSARTFANGEIPKLFAEVLIGDDKPKWFPESWPVDKGSMQSFVNEGHHYVKYGDGSEELFNFENDPEEKDDLADFEEYQARLEQMRLAVKTVLMQTHTFK